MAKNPIDSPFGNIVENQLLKDIAAITEDIAAADRPNKMPEELFVMVFLPMFAGDKDLHKAATFHTWISYAGSPFKEVSIVDQDKVELFLVPPMNARIELDYKRERGAPSVQTKMQYANMHTARHPAQGNEYMRLALQSIMVNKEDNTKALNYLRRWNEIFKRYGRPLIELPALPASAGDNQTTQSTAQAEEKWEMA